MVIVQDLEAVEKELEAHLKKKGFETFSEENLEARISDIKDYASKRKKIRSTKPAIIRLASLDNKYYSALKNFLDAYEGASESYSLVKSETEKTLTGGTYEKILAELNRPSELNKVYKINKYYAAHMVILLAEDYELFAEKVREAAGERNP